MAVPFLSSITLNKNEVQDFKVFNIGTGNPTLSSGGDIGYFWTDTSGSASTRVLKWWDGSNVRTVLDSSSTTIVAADLSGGAAGSLPYQQGASDTTFLGIGTANQVLTVNTGATAPQWTSQSNLSVGTATFLAGGAQGSIPVQSAAGTTGFLTIGAAGRILTSDGTTPVWSATIPSSSVSGLAASATTDTTNAANITSGLLPLARLELADGSFYVGNGSNVPTATAKNLIPISGFGAATAAVAMGNQKITGLADPVDATDAANRKYVDEVAQGLDVKASCLTATTTNINLSAPTASIGGVTISTVGSRVLVKDQTDKTQNGIYLWQGASSAMTRSLDADTVAKLVGAFTFVEQGTNADSGWVCQVDSGTIGSVNIEWVKFSQAGSYTEGNGMVLVGGQFSFATANPYTPGQIPYASSTTAIGFKSVTGTGDVVLATSPTLVTPALGTPTSGNLSSCTGLSLTTGVSGTLPVGNGGTGASTFTAGRVLFGNGTSALNTSANLFWDNGNSRLGIGTASPGYTLDVNGNLSLSGVSGGSRYILLGAETSSYTGSLIIQAGAGSAAYGGGIVLYGHSHATYPGGVWIGRSGSATGPIMFGDYGTGPGNKFLQLDTGGVCTWYDGAGGTRMTLNGNGLGLGVTPSAWGSSYKAIQIGQVGSINYKNFTIAIGGNYYNDGTNDVTLINGYRSKYEQNLSNGTHIWYQAGIGTGNVSWNQSMTLDASGNLGVGATTPVQPLEINKSSSSTALTSPPVAGSTIRVRNTSNTDNAFSSLEFYNSAGLFGGSVNCQFVSQATPSNDLVFVTRGSSGGLESLRITSAGSTLSGVNGTASNPSFSRIADPNTGLYFPTGNDTLALAVGGSDAVYIDSSRNVGIGTTPGYKLDIRDNSTGLLARLSSTSTGGCSMQFVSTSTNGRTYRIGSNYVSGAGEFSIYDDTAGLERLRIKSGGQLNLVGLNSAPTGAVGDLYYNSTSNTLQYHNNSAFQQISRKYTVALNDGSVTVVGNAYTLTHNMGSRDITVSVRRSTDNVVVLTDVSMPSTTTATITFAAAITAADYTVTVIG